jgi:hypothetical protein
MNENEMLAYCGLICEACPIYLATRQETSEERARMRADIAKQCKEHYGLAYSLEDITDCDGCRTEDGRLFSGCRNCAVRTCARERMFDNCAACPEYACEKLASIFTSDPAAGTRLNEIRKLRSSG